MVRVEEVDDVEIKVLLEPDDVRLGSVEDLHHEERVSHALQSQPRRGETHLDNPRIRQHLPELPHPAPHLWHDKINYPVLSPLAILRLRGNLHQAEEASVRPERVMLEIDRDVRLVLKPGDELA